MIGGVETHTLFDAGTTHGFVSPDMIEKGMFRFGIWNGPDKVSVAGG